MRYVGWLLLLAVLTAGCMPKQVTRPAAPPPPPPRPAGPVMAEQVNPGNYREKVDALDRELTHEEQGGGSAQVGPR